MRLDELLAASSRVQFRSVQTQNRCIVPWLVLAEAVGDEVRELGGQFVTLGSDAHAAEDLGAGIPEAMQMACDAGFEYFTFYKKRQPRLLQIY